MALVAALYWQAGHSHAHDYSLGETIVKKQPARAVRSIIAAIILAMAMLGPGVPQETQAAPPPGIPNLPVTRFATLPSNASNPEGMTADAQGNIYANSFNTAIPCTATTRVSDSAIAGAKALMAARGGNVSTSEIAPGTPNFIFVYDANGALKSATPFLGCEGGLMAAPLGMHVIGNQLFVIDVFTGVVHRYNLPLTNTSTPDRSYPICGGFFAAFGPDPSTFCALNDMKKGPDDRLYLANNAAGPLFVFSNCCLTGQIFVLDPVSGASSVFYQNPALNVDVTQGPQFGVVANVFSLDGKTLYLANFSTDFIHSIQVSPQNPNLPPSLSNPLVTPTGPLNVVFHDASVINGPNHMAFDNAGRLWVTGGQNNTVVGLYATPNGPSRAAFSAGSFCGFAPDGAPACLLQPANVVFANGLLYVGNEANVGLSPQDTDLPPTDPQWTTTLKLWTISKFTPPGGAPGGRAFGITSSGGKVLTSWAGGDGQFGYLLGRLANNVFTTFPTSGPPLPANTTSYVDTTAPPGIDCYWLFPLSTTRSGLSSDLLCATVGIESGNAPRDFTIELNQGFVATLSWVAPSGGGQTGYSLATVGGGITPLGADATSAQVVVNGFSCFLLQARSGNTVLGTAEAVCATPGFSTLGQ
jgi:hypothetical protein